MKFWTLFCFCLGCLLLPLVGCGSSGSETGSGSEVTATSPPGALYEGTSIEQANMRLPFSLIAPDPPPAPFTQSSITVHRPITVNDSALEATLEYSVSNGSGQTVLVYQTTERVKTPTAEAMQEAALIGAKTSAVSLPSPQQEHITFAEHPVLQTVIYTPDGTPLLTYSWELGDLHFDVTGSLTDEVTVDDLERLVAAFIQSVDADGKAVSTIEMPDSKAPEVVRNDPPVVIPRLTDDEEARIVAIAELDPFVQEAFGDRAYRVAEIGVWITEDTLEKIGGSVLFRFAEPATIEMDWLCAERDPNLGTYTTSTRHFRATNVTGLNVIVDLNREEVVSMGPGIDAEITGTPDMTCGGA